MYNNKGQCVKRLSVRVAEGVYKAVELLNVRELMKYIYERWSASEKEVRCHLFNNPASLTCG